MGAKKTQSRDGSAKGPLVCKNRRAFHDYDVEEEVEAGLVLLGTEVKACREGKADIKDAYVLVRSGEAFLVGSRISEYRCGNRFNHPVDRTRKLLLHRKEIDKLESNLRQKGKVSVPVSMYFLQGRVKVLLALGRGRRHSDKRRAIKEREIRREMDRVIRRHR